MQIFVFSSLELSYHNHILWSWENLILSKIYSTRNYACGPLCIHWIAGYSEVYLYKWKLTPVKIPYIYCSLVCLIKNQASVLLVNSLFNVIFWFYFIIIYLLQYINVNVCFFCHFGTFIMSEKLHTSDSPFIMETT